MQLEAHLAHWLDWQEQVDWPLPAGRIYLGSESCINQMPDADALTACQRRLQKEGRALTLVTPPVNEPGLARLAGLLGNLDGEPVEVVCNDWGVFELVLTLAGCHAVIGRLLSRQCVDPRLARLDDDAYQAGFERQIPLLGSERAWLKYQPPTPELLRHLRSPAIMQAELLHLLVSLGVERIELSHLPQGLDLDLPTDLEDRLHFSLHFPKVVLALRRCPESYRPGCSLACHHERQCQVLPGFVNPIWLTACEVYSFHTMPPVTNLRMGVDRLVENHLSRENNIGYNLSEFY